MKLKQGVCCNPGPKFPEGRQKEAVSSEKVNYMMQSMAAVELGSVFASLIDWLKTCALGCFLVCSKIYSVTAELTIITALPTFPFSCPVYAFLSSFFAFLLLLIFLFIRALHLTADTCR